MELCFSPKKVFYSVYRLWCCSPEASERTIEKSITMQRKTNWTWLKKQYRRSKYHLITALNNYSFVSACLKDSDCVLKCY